MKPKHTYIFLVLCVIVSSMITGISYAQVTAKFTAKPKSGCAPLFVSFTNSSSGTGTLTYTWDFGNGNTSNLPGPSQTFNSCGNYVVTLTVSNGTQTSVDTAHITVYCEPTASFTYNSPNGCPGSCINFTNTSTAGSGTITNTFWDFGDGNTSTVASPVHCYTSSGNFNVTLTVINSLGCTNSIVITNAITIYTPPVANFSGSPVSQCKVPATVNFSNFSTGTGNLTYNWNFGDPASGVSDTSTLTAPNHIYNVLGSYTVSLIVTDANGCMDTLILPNYINIGSLSTTITSSSSEGCCPLMVNFGETSTGTPLGYNWTFGGGIANSTMQNPQITFPCPVGNNPEIYNVTLTETFAGGCTANATTTITVSNEPVADFTSNSNLTTCTPPQVVAFNNNTVSGAGTKFEWFFGDGDTSSSVNPSHTYTACGSYNVMLIATNIYGCSDTINKLAFINVTCPVAGFTIASAGGCIPVAVAFNSDTSTGHPVTWNWNFGDPGSGTDNLSNLQNPTHTYTQPGCYNVTLITTNALGCTDSIQTKNAVCVDNPATPGFSATPLTTCAHIPVSFTNLSTGTDSLSTYFWSFGDTTTSTDKNPSHIYNDTGYLSVTLIVCNAGCCDTLRLVNYVHILPPIANIDVINDCQYPYNVCFDGSRSIGADTYDWNFGDPVSGILDSSTSINPCHLYSGSGNYNVSLTVYNDSTGCSFTQKVNVYVRKVKAAFTISPPIGCPPLNLTSVNNSLDASSYNWIVTDSATNAVVFTSTQTTPTFTFTTSGIYFFELIATDTNGCSDTLIIPFNLASSFINANFTYSSSGCLPLDVQFIDGSTSTGGPIVKWSWEFDDPGSGAANFSSLQNPTHVFVQTGYYTVGLTVTNSLGCTSSIYIAGTAIISIPSTNFNTLDTTECAGNQVCFTNLTTGTGNSYTWNFGDPASGTNDSSNLVNPCHIYNSAGVYTVSLKSITPGGCDSMFIKTNYITISQPVANFGVNGNTSSICPPLLVNFIDSSQSNIISWQWNFGDGNTSTNQNPSHVYSIPGSYTVTLVVTNSSGCMDTLVRLNYIVVQGPNATFTFTPDSGCAPLDVCFKANTLTDNLTFIWNYGNTTSGPILNGDSICFNYTLPGIYHPSLIIQDSAGCTSSVNSPDSVWVQGPEAKFVISEQPMCGSGLVNFIDSTSSVYQIASLNWNFGDPLSGSADTSSLQNPSHNYSVAGIYPIILTVTTVDGCIGTYVDTLTLLPDPITLINVINNPVCAGGVISFKDSSITLYKLASWAWDFGDSVSGGLDTSTLENTSHQYNNAGTYTVKLIVVDSMGCMDSISAIVTVNPIPVINAGPNQNICSGTSTTLNASGGANYLWTPSTGLSSATGSIVTANPTVSTTYTVTGISSVGCSDTAIAIVTVNPIPVISVTPSSSSICSGTSTTMSVTGATSYIWTPVAGLSSSTDSIVTANPTITTNYTVTGTNSYGCTGMATAAVSVSDMPVLNFTPTNPSICSGNNTVLTVSGATSYTWTPSAGLSSATDSVVTANPTVTTTYTVTGTIAGSSCPGSSGIIILTVDTNPVINIVPQSAFFCQGGNVTFSVTGAKTYAWSPVSGINSTIDSVVTADPVTSTTYTIIGTNSYGCTGSTVAHVTVNSNPVLNVIPLTPAICTGNSTTITATGALSYIWTPSTELSSDTGSVVTASPAIKTTYTVTGLNAAGCPGKDSVTIMVNPLPVITLIPASPSICSGASTILTASGASSYLWSPSTGLNTTIGVSVIANPTITTSYTVSATDTNGCTSASIISVKVNPNPVVTAAGPSAICTGQSAVLIANGALNYEWTPSIALSATSGATVTVNPTISTTYRVTGIDINSCEDSSSLALAVNSLPIVSLLGLSPFYCVNASQVELFGSPPGGIYSGNSVIGNIFNPDSAGAGGPYIITYAYDNTNGCIDSASIPVTILALPDIIVIPNKPVICAGTPALLTASGAVSYEWRPSSGLSDTTGNSVMANPTTTSTYMIIGISDSGCADTTTITVNVDSLPRASFSSKIPNSCEPRDVQFINTSTGGASYSWDFGDEKSSTEQNPLHSYDRQGTYSVTLTVSGADGCEDIASNPDTLVAGEYPLEIGNAFTPGNNGINSYIAPHIICNNLSNYVFRIYNRWGQLVFQSYDPSQGWDGKFNGQMEPIDVYDYYIGFNCGSDCNIFKKGNITLLK